GRSRPDSRTGYSDRSRSDNRPEYSDRSRSDGRTGYPDRSRPEGRSDFSDQSRSQGRSGYAGQSRSPGQSRSGGGQFRSQPEQPRVPRAVIRIDQVQRVLGEILQWTYPADASLSHWFRAHPALGGRDRGEVAEAVYDVLRHLRRYRQLAESGSGPASRRLAILGLTATLGAAFLEDGLDPSEHDWLERV